MNIDAYSVFVNMFQALNALWDECRDETLAGFLSEANPFLFKDKGSADPAIWSEFRTAFEERFPDGCQNLDDAYSFVQSYLHGISDEYSKAYPGKWRLDDAILEIAPADRWSEVYKPFESD